MADDLSMRLIAVLRESNCRARSRARSGIEVYLSCLYERTQVMTAVASFPRKRESSNLDGNFWQKQ
jgi:hypothetical protein